jgi:hypothetical protein
MARARKDPQIRLTKTPVTGVHKPREALGPTEHHLGWDRALQKALDDIGRPRGRYQLQVQFTAVVDVTNPGRIIEYQATLFP